MKKEMDKYLFQCKTFCIKCETAKSFYKPSEKGEVLGMICSECFEKLEKLSQELREPCYWTSIGRVRTR